MCGFAGVLNLDGSPTSPTVVRPMLEAIAHRGPDGEGLFCQDALGLGHRRLAIVDRTAAASQPMITQQRAQVLAFNGCLYNFRELRAELEAQGAEFQSSGDTEVVLQAFVHWGPRCVSRFNGMFAIAYWDAASRRLLLARDRYGLKPLYFAVAGESLVFGSEIKALLRHPKMQVRVCRSAFREYFTFQNILSENTLFEGVRLLPAGTTLEVGLPTSKLPEPVRYWDFDFREDPTLDETTCVRTVQSLVEQAVERQIVGDVALGSFLSGGIDSGSIAVVAAARLPSLRTFTCGFDVSRATAAEQPFDERPGAALLSRMLGTSHHEVQVEHGDMERVMQALTWHLEEPRLGQSCPNYLVSRLAREHVGVALSGAGGDELFAGYPWRYRLSDERGDGFLDRHYASWQRLVPGGPEPELFRPEILGAAHPRSAFDKIHERGGGFDGRGSTPAEAVNHILAFDARTFLAGLLLVEDKLAMAHGLEVRAPLLDNDLVDFAMRIPVRHKLGSQIAAALPGGGQEASGGKRVLRQVFDALLPGAPTDGSKQGFSAPDASWFRFESAPYVRELLAPRTARIHDYLRPEAVTAILEEHETGRANHRRLIWSLLSMEWWLRTFEPGSALP